VCHTFALNLHGCGMTTKKNEIQDLSFAFAILIVAEFKTLISERKESSLSKHMLKSGTSIGANVEEALGGQSRADFISKMSIAYKESRETVYWIRLLHSTGYLKSESGEKFTGKGKSTLQNSQFNNFNQQEQS